VPPPDVVAAQAIAHASYTSSRAPAPRPAPAARPAAAASADDGDWQSF
jgi:hypothetical protein